MRIKKNALRGDLRFEVQINSLDNHTHQQMQALALVQDKLAEAMSDVEHVIAGHLRGAAVTVVIK